ncbi:MAG TPA: tRNA (adenosine(37)-N6)-threonylcarbamoyltransferase complex dimerization subunit type 1 TsaB [Micavibrio sp.]
MRVLALDTAMNGCAVGVLDTESQECVAVVEPMPRGHAEKLVPLIQKALTKARLDFPDLGLIATTVGPGAFTGLRIGLSTSRALGLALNIPVLGVTTLHVLAAAYFAKHQHGKNLLVLIETKRTDFYGQLFDAEGSARSEPFALSARVIADAYMDQDCVIIGDANARFLSLLDAAQQARVTAVAGFEIPDPAFVAVIGHALFENGDTDAPAEPLYLRDADVSQSKKVQRTIED